MKRAILIACGMLAILSGCGQRGGLYLPEERSAEVEKTPPPQAEETDRDNKKKPQ